MPADPLATVNPSDPVEFSAATDNAIRAAARKVRDQWPRADIPPNVIRPSALALPVRNDSGSDLDTGSIVTLTSAIPDPTSFFYNFLGMPAFAAGAPVAVTDQPFVLLEPIPDEGFGYAAVMGVALCRVNVQSASHLFAYPEVGDTANLKSSRDGPVRILWPAGTVGSSVLCAVLLGIGPGGPGLCTPFVQDWSCVSNVATVTKKGLWLPPGMATLYDDEAACDSANPGA